MSSEEHLSARQDALAVQDGRLPDFFIVGHPKSGTTALYEMLRVHPQIFMSELKEPWFFADERHSRPRSAASAELPDTLEEYTSLFAAAAAEQRVGEASARYLWSRSAASAIARVAPGARIIAILREPASFLHSLHLQLVLQHQETEKDLERAIALEPDRREGRYESGSPSYWPQVLQYSEYVRYVEQLRRYHSVFPPEQVLILVYEEFRRDNEATVRQVLDFLDVDAASPIKAVEANPTVRVRSLYLNDMVRAVYMGEGSLGRGVHGALKAISSRGLRRTALGLTQRRVLHASPRPPDERLKGELRQRFKGEVVALSEYLGRDLVTLWGYDRVG